MKHFEEYKGEYCCASMKHQLEDYKMPLDFNPEIRRYFIPLAWPCPAMTTLNVPGVAQNCLMK